MELRTDGRKFAKIQSRFVEEIVAIVKTRLAQEGLEGTRLKEAIGDIVFPICILIDGSSSFEIEGQEFSPFLAFSDEPDVMFYPGGNSYLHEYVFDVINGDFKND